MPLPKTTRFFAFFLILLSLTSCDLLLGPMLDGAGQSPDQIEGLSLWLRADKGVYEDVLSEKPTQDGGGVLCWEDQSGNKNHATSGSGPLWHKGGPINGKPSILFNNSYTLGGPLSGITFQTIISVSFSNITLASIRYFFTLIGSSIAQGLSMEQKYYLLGSPDINTNVSFGSPTLFTSQIDKNFLMKAFINGKERGKVYFGNAPSLSSGYTIGDSFFDGHIAEILVYNRPLSDSERQDVESYLGKKYGIDPAE